MRVEDTLGLACKALGARSGPDNARPLYLLLNFILEIFYLARGILRAWKNQAYNSTSRQTTTFGTLATVLDLVSQDLDRCGYKPHAGTLSRLRDDLVYLQQSHCIQEITRSG